MCRFRIKLKKELRKDKLKELIKPVKNVFKKKSNLCKYKVVCSVLWMLFLFF